MSEEDDIRPGILVNNHQTVEGLQRAILDAPRDVDLLRMTLRRALRENAWMDRLDPHRGARWKYRQDEFLKFITDPLPDGLDTDVPTLEKFIREDVELYAMFLEATTRGAGNPTGANQHGKDTGPGINDNIINSSRGAQQAEQGTSKSYAIRRLSRDRPDLLEKVQAGELSAHAAMVEAGFRRVPTVLEVMQKGWRKLSPQERDAFLEWVSNEGA